MVGWHHWPNEHEFEQTLGDGEGQGGLACCSPWGRKESDTTERLNDSNKSGREVLVLLRAKGGQESPHLLMEKEPSEPTALLPRGGRELNFPKTYYMPNTMLHASCSAGTTISHMQKTQFPSSNLRCIEKLSI